MIHVYSIRDESNIYMLTGELYTMILPTSNSHQMLFIFALTLFATSYFCAFVYGACGKTGGSLNITRQSDLDATSSCTTILGSVGIDGNLEKVTFSPALDTITGSLSNLDVGNTIKSVQALSLTKVGTEINGYDSGQEVSVTGGIYFFFVPSLESLSFPKLTSIGNNGLIIN